MNIRRGLLVLVIVVVGALGFATCQLPIDASGYIQGSGPGGSDLVGASITNEYPSGPAETYTYSGSGTSVSATSPPGEDGNERDAFWFSNSPVAQNEESCSTWDSAPGTTQQGEMLHMAQASGGAVHGIAVMDNIYNGKR